MNLVHLKYAVEVAETGSINKASEKLYVSQPNLSRAIKELEASLGVTIFDRSAKGMVLTPDGEVFVRYARSILRQVDAIEEVFSKGTTEKKKFSISVPRASYVTDAFAEFSKLLDKDTPGFPTSPLTFSGFGISSRSEINTASSSAQPTRPSAIALRCQFSRAHAVLQISGNFSTLTYSILSKNSANLLRFSSK